MKNAVSGIGLAPDTAMVTFPIDVFLPGADLSSLKGRRQEFYDGLTRWTSSLAEMGNSPMLSIEADTYEDALFRVNRLFIDKRWGDGSPLWPATKSYVDWILRGSAFPRSRVIGKFPPRGGIATVESCAIALAMSGGRPEYLPVLISAVEAFLDPAARSDQLQATSASTFPVVIVNGPIGRQIRLNSGFGCLGPDPQYPAGASIGRALRQMQQNLGGSVPGIGTMALWGAMRYNNVVFAEDEEGLPQGWQTHAGERHGFAPGSNSVSLIFATGATNIMRRGAGLESEEEDAVQGLYRIAGFLAVPHMQYTRGYDNGTPGVLLISKVVAGSLADLGWSKEKIREFLWQHSKIPMAQLENAGGPAWIRISPTQMARDSIHLDPWPIAARPDNIAIVVCGGGHPTHAFWIQAFSHDVTGRRIVLPEGFQRLLEEADRDVAACHAFTSVA